jgi:hypothetical protein
LLRKLVIQRIFLLCLLYCLVFFVIVIIQFSGGESFTAAPTVVLEEKKFSPDDFIITGSDYDAAISRWRDRNFEIWNRLVLTQNDEELVTSFIGEAADRSAYRTAVSAIPAAFLNGNRRTYLSTVYLGRLEQSARTLINGDREKLNRILSLIQEKSLDLLKEDGIFEFSFTRGYSYSQDGAGFIGSIDPETVELVHVPGIFQGFYDWNNYFSAAENPFAHLVDKACELVFDSLWTDSEKTVVFAVIEDKADTELNIRLGKALLDWAEISNDESWAMIARAIILSVLSLETSNTAGSISAELHVEEDISEVPESARLSTALLYSILKLGKYRPRSIVLGPQANNAWAWTVGLNISASMQNNILDISVDFPVGESHYMIIRGVRPFTSIQFYGTDWRSDPQYERYDSSGWAYLTGDQTLLLKVRHRTATEHIRISYQPVVYVPPAPVATPAPEPTPATEPLPDTGTSAATESPPSLWVWD